MIGGGILRRIGWKVGGRIINRITDGIGTPAVKKGWEPPGWLVLILRAVVAIIDHYVPRSP